MLVLLLLFVSVARSEPLSCYHPTACYDASNTLGFALCSASGGELSAQSCCDGYCATHQGFAGCSACEYECPLSSIYCPITIGDELRPDCDRNACVEGVCTHGGASCGGEYPQCPCVCGSGQEQTECTAHPQSPPKPCHHTLKCNHLYMNQLQPCVRDVCVKAPGAHRGHALHDASEPCYSDNDTPCICESTGHACEYAAPEPPPAQTCDAICDFDTDDTCETSSCVRQFPHQHFGHCQFNSYEQCLTDADCGCVCHESHKPCRPAPVLCPSMQCLNETAGSMCHFQHCQFALGQDHGACTLCGSPCSSDEQCPCVCDGDHKTRCVPGPTTTAPTTTAPPTTTTTMSTATSTTINTPCCAQLVDVGGGQLQLSCNQFDNQCPSDWLLNADTVPPYCNDVCLPVLGCCEDPDADNEDGVSCEPDLVAAECELSYGSMTTQLQFCNASCLPIRTCCYANGACSDTTLAHCVDIEGTANAAGSMTCNDRCEPIGCCFVNDQCSEVSNSDCGGIFTSGPCCPTRPECGCISPAPTPAPTPSPTPCSGECPSVFADSPAVGGVEMCTLLQTFGTCAGEAMCIGIAYNGTTQAFEQYVCNTNTPCAGNTCECASLCGCLYEAGFVRCSDIPQPTTTTTTTPTTTMTTPSPTPAVCGNVCPILNTTGGNTHQPLININTFCTLQVPTLGSPGYPSGYCAVPVVDNVLTGALTCVYTTTNYDRLPCFSGPTTCVEPNDPCTCDLVCSCKYQNTENAQFLYDACSSSTTTATTTESATTTSTSSTTPAPTTSTTPTPTPSCDVDAPTVCGVRPGCKGGARDGKECVTVRDCPGGDACVPLHKACQNAAPCFACESTDPKDALRTCRVCLECTEEEIVEQAAHPEHKYAFKCCPVGLNGAIDGPVPPEDKCDKSTGAPSDCARAYNCMCEIGSCEDAHDGVEGCGPFTSDICSGATVVQENEYVAAHIICGDDACDSDYDYFLLNVTRHKGIVVYLSTPSAHVSVSQLGCPGVTEVALFDAATVGGTDEGFTAYQLTVASFGVYAIQIRVDCVDGVACVPYKLFFKTQPVLCPAALCDLHTCISTIDCGTDASCFGCDNKYGRCVERSNCATDDCCLSAGEPADTCIDAADGVACVICNGENCLLASCFNGACTTGPYDQPFNCDCRCARMCWKDEDCELIEGYTRDCDMHNGACVYRAIPPEQVQSLSIMRGQRTGVKPQCMRDALDASERGYASYAMDRFGAFDANGQRRPALCGGSVEWQRIAVDGEDVPTTLQSECCVASFASWRTECFHGDDEATESGHTWADRAWHLMQSARALGQSGRAQQATAKACCASLIWAAIGKACGRTTDAWGVGALSVETADVGPVAKWFEDGAGDRDTNDAGLLVSQSTLRRADGSIGAVNTHTILTARGGAYSASLGLAFGASGAFTPHRPDESALCPDRERRLQQAVLDQTATRRQLEAIARPPADSFVAVLRHVYAAADNKVPVGIADAECFTVAGAGTTICPPSPFVALYPTTSSALPLREATLRELLEANIKYREPVVNTQSGTRYQAPLYAASSSYVPSRAIKAAEAPFVLRNHDCGVSILDGDTTTAHAPLVVTIPADTAPHWRCTNEGVPLLVAPDSIERFCRSGPLSGSEHCTNDAVCDGGYCALPATKSGVAYPYATEHFECVARRVDCSVDPSSRCCLPQVLHWERYSERSKELVYEPLPQNK